MSNQARREAVCGVCAFWIHAEALDGHCRLLAPRPGVDPNLPARWARTRRADFCGDWRAGSDAVLPSQVACRHCDYWEHVAGGITPVDLADQPEMWWSKAGHCKRHPPRAAALSGAKAHWLVTHESDGCFEGKRSRV